jgi:predicted amidohydrolase
VFDLPIGRVGLLIGHDAMFPEAVRSLSLLGCDLVACPAAISGRFTGAHGGTAIRHNYPIPTGADPYHWHAFRVRAGESNVSRSPTPSTRCGAFTAVALSLGRTRSRFHGRNRRF